LLRPKGIILLAREDVREKNAMPIEGNAERKHR
jgi:hypothetical protein